MSLRHTTIDSRWVVRVLLTLGLTWMAFLRTTPGQAQDAGLTVNITSTPPLASVRPNHDLASITLTPMLRGKPLGQGHVTLVLTAPPAPTILATGFPRVEGTTLLRLDSALTNGGLTFKYAFPLRGQYTVDLALTPVPGGPVFPPTRVQQTLHLSEDPSVARNAWMLVAGLFVLGGIAGVMFARSAAAQERRLAFGLIALLLGGSILGIVQPVAADSSHSTTAAPAASAHQVVQGDDGWTLDVQVQPSPVTVGQLAECTVTLRKDGEIFTEATAIALVVVHQEEGHTVFETHLVAPKGQSTPSLQLYDGAPHTLTVTARPTADAWRDVPPLTASLETEVIALHPPTPVKVRMMTLLLGVLVLGMCAGFFVPQRTRERTDA